MIELLQFRPAMGLLNASPFCMKVEVFLRLAGLEYRTVESMPPGTPKGKLPVVRDGDRTVADSQAILDYLRETYGARLPASLASPETAAQHLLRRTFEEHLYFAVLHFRWLRPDGAALTRQFFNGLPAPVRPLVFALVQRKVRRDLLGQGLGRHDDAEITARACADLDAVAQALGGQPYFAGAHPGAIDACAYAFLANLIRAPLEIAIKAHALAQPTLVAYVERMHARVGD